MHMSAESLLIILFIGAVAGWLAGQIVQGTGFGLVGDIIIGIVGAFIAIWLFPPARYSSWCWHCCRDHRRHHRCRTAARYREAGSARRALVAGL